MEKIIRENRFGHLCSRRKLGDKYHYIFECTKFIIEIKLYFDFVHRNWPNIIKYNNSVYTLCKLWKFIRTVNNRICPLGWSTSFTIQYLFNYVLHVFISCVYCVNSHLCTSLNWSEWVSEWVSEWLLFNANSAIFQLYHGENKLIFNEMMSALY
jgi:hypothetical protein